jgi:murein L,D-transpeptidase YcbB/YkuD
VRRIVLLIAVAVSLAALVAALVWLWRDRHVPGPMARASEAIRMLLAEDGPHRGAVPSDRVRRALFDFYRRGGHRPAWSDGRRPDVAAFEMVRVLGGAGAEGLEPTEYESPALARELDAITRKWRAAPPESLARFDVRLTRASLRYAGDLHYGCLPDSALDPGWIAARDNVDLSRALRKALKSRDLAGTLAGLAPRDSAYRSLRDALGRYRAIAARGGWPVFPDGPTLSRGARGEPVAALVRRLAYEDDVDTTAREPAFDARVERAVRRFQARHGVHVTGGVGPATRAALNVTAAARVRQIALNLERCRWLSRAVTEPCIVVNLPDYHLALHDSGRVVLAMGVVVGERRNPTPVFSDTVTYLELNPLWRVPKRIVVEEILPALRRDTTYLAKNHMRVMFNRAIVPVEVPYATVDWTAIEQDTFPYLVSQDGGPDNPVGRLKFMCPNEYDVYLHDTPAQNYFQMAARAFSHGCVRVERPLELADRLLEGTLEAPRDSVDVILASGLHRYIGLKRRMPVHLLYWTAWRDSEGTVQFREDLYDIDRRLDEALRSRRRDAFVLNPPVEWGTLHRRDGATPASGREAGAGANDPLRPKPRRNDDQAHVSARLRSPSRAPRSRPSHRGHGRTRPDGAPEARGVRPPDERQGGARSRRRSPRTRRHAGDGPARRHLALHPLQPRLLPLPARRAGPGALVPAAGRRSRLL